MSAVWVAVGTAVVGAGMQYAGSEKAAQAAKDAASAQNKAANDWSDYVRGDKAQALSMVNTPSQIAAYQEALNSQEANVKRQEQLVASIHPALIEAGKQMNDLLQGKAAPVLGQIQNQRSLQRQQMLEQLRTQLGPGAETSSAGQQALQRFDQQTAGMMSDVQQQYLDKVSNISLQGNQTLGDALNHANATLTSIQQTSPGAQAADVMAKFDAAESGAQSAMVNSAGGQYAGAQIQGQNMANIGSTAMTLGAMYAGKQGLAEKTPTGDGKPLTDASGNSVSADNFQQPQLGSSAARTGFQSNLLGGSVTPPPRVASAGAGVPAAQPQAYNGPGSPGYTNYQGASNAPFDYMKYGKPTSTAGFD